MTGADGPTLAVYDGQADTYVDAFVPEPDDPVLAAFIGAMPTGARVLDLGCGAGHHAAAMRDAGLDVVALDASPGLAAVARQRFGLDVVQGSFDDLPHLGRFAGVWAMFSLLHARRADLPRHLAAIHAALVPPGRFVISMKTAPEVGATVPDGGETRDPLGRFYAYVAEDELNALATEAGFTVTARKRGASAGFDGVIAPWVIVTAHG